MISEVLANTTVRQRCSSIRKDGQPCRAWANTSGFCVGHSPGSAEARRRGGYNSSKRARADKLLPLRLKPILESLEAALVEVHSGVLDHRKASAMAALAGAITKVYESGLLEERLTALEERNTI